MTTVPTSTGNPLSDKVLAIDLALGEEVFERGKEIHGSLLAICTGSHCFFYGIPGVAKSFIVERILKRIGGAKYFHILMGSFTGPEELVGPLDVAALENGSFRRVTEGYLPWADFAFEDEIWKTNDGILQTQLGVFNERQFRNDGKMGKIPLSTVFAASNELPANDSLAAIYDRILLRYDVSDLQEAESFFNMLKTKISDDVEVLLTMDEIQEIKRQVAAMPVDNEVYKALWEIRRDLQAENIMVSSRRFKQAMVILQGEAWMEGASSVEVDHVSILTNVLWDDPVQIETVEKIVLEKANPLEKETLALLKDIDLIGELVTKALDAKDEEEAQSVGMEAHPKIKKAAKDLKALEKQAGNSRRQQALITRAKEKLHGHSKICITEVFRLPESEASKLTGS